MLMTMAHYQSVLKSALALKSMLCWRWHINIADEMTLRDVSEKSTIIIIILEIIQSEITRGYFNIIVPRKNTNVM